MHGVNELQRQQGRIINAAILPALFILLIWLVLIVDHTLGLNLARFGIVPRDLQGLRGILFAPMLHADMEHAFGNSSALLMLGWALMYFYPRASGRVVFVTWLVSGAWVWISARYSNHIGASGVVYGLAAFLLFSGLMRRQRTLMALSMLVVFLYGSMVWGIFPIVPRMSWESHLWGAVGGALIAWLYRHIPASVKDPTPPVLEDEEEEQLPHPSIPMMVTYHLDTGNEVNDAEQLPPSAQGSAGAHFHPDRTSGTWSTEKRD